MEILLLLISFSAFVFFISLYYFSSAKENSKKQAAACATKKEFSKASFVIPCTIFIVTFLLLNKIIFAIIFVILYLYFSWNIKHRNFQKNQNLIDRQVMEALSIIKSSVQVGNSIQNALIVAQNELKEPLKTEFRAISSRIALGVNVGEALEAAAKNTQNKELKFMFNTLIISKDTGASLSGIFEKINDMIAQRITIGRKISALTAQGKMSGNIVSSIPFVVIAMTYLIEPEITGVLFTTFAGNILLLIIVVLTISGSFIIKKMTEVKL
ncbi:MAG: type II secretion system F family protein [Elusimicrobiota bacterium]|jgi:tight adherence protein B|nr:type II secretion system F family protein [Elusimicrobiota bacterium]